MVAFRKLEVAGNRCFFVPKAQQSDAGLCHQYWGQKQKSTVLTETEVA